MVRPLDESQGSSPLQGHGSWLMCEVALIHGDSSSRIVWTFQHGVGLLSAPGSGEEIN